MREVIWTFKLVDKDDYAAPIPGVDLDKILIFYSLDGVNFIKVGGSFTWGTMDWFTWQDLDLYTWNELERTTDTAAEEIGNGWYCVRFTVDNFASIIVKALAPWCAQCDEKLYFCTDRKWRLKK